MKLDLAWAVPVATQDIPLPSLLSDLDPPALAAPAVVEAAVSAPDFELVILALWLGGAFILLGRWAIIWRRLSRVREAAWPSGIGAAIPIHFSRSLLGPGLVGVFRPVLLLPEGITAHLSRHQLALVIEHELCHWRRRDNLTAAIHMAVQLMFWFHPLLWWIGSRLVAERERACDESVLAAGNDPKDYAGSILEVCRFYARSPLACASGVAGANLKDRVTRILENVGLARLSDLKRAILGTGAIGAVVFPMASGLFAIEPAAAYPAASAAVPAAYRSSLLPARKPAVPSTAKARLIDMPIASGPEPGAFVAASATVAAAEVSNAANAPRVQAQLPRAVEERVAPETLLAQADAAGASVPPPASSPALTPPPSSPLDEIVVTAKRVREFVQTRNFVRMYTAPSSFLDQISRWQAPVCVHTVGLKPAYNAFVTARLK